VDAVSDYREPEEVVTALRKEPPSKELMEEAANTIEELLEQRESDLGVIDRLYYGGGP
jgi:hypothetical protein